MEKTRQAAAVIAHELNNALMIVDLSLDMLKEQSVENDKTKHLLKVAHENIMRGAELNQQLLEIAQGRSD